MDLLKWLHARELLRIAAVDLAVDESVRPARDRDVAQHELTTLELERCRINLVPAARLPVKIAARKPWPTVPILEDPDFLDVRVDTFDTDVPKVVVRVGNRRRRRPLEQRWIRKTFDGRVRREPRALLADAADLVAHAVGDVVGVD